MRDPILSASQYDDAPAPRQALFFAFLPTLETAGSWWVHADRAALNREAEHHRARMRASAAYHLLGDRSLAKMSAPYPGTGKSRAAIDPVKLERGMKLIEGEAL